MDDTSGRVDAKGTPRSDAPSSEETERMAGRASETARGYVADRDDPDLDRRTQQIRREIEETRGEMSETIDVIQEKLKPRNIVANATDRVKNATTERVREMADTASETAQQAMDYTRETAANMAGTARQNPIPLALIGVGTAWLLMNRSRESSRERARYGRGRDDYRERDYGRDSAESYVRTRDDDRYEPRAGLASQMASRTTEYASATADSMRRMARRRQNQLQRMIEQNPLLVGAGALMLGLAFGMAVPETDAENEWMGETRDTMIDRARDVARDAANQVQEAAGTVVDAAKKVTGTSQS